jgi:outer membrane protein OmpA-like peptidoglycan-associated protein
MTAKGISAIAVVFMSMAVAPPLLAEQPAAAPVDGERTVSTCDEAGTLVEFRARSTRLSPGAKVALAEVALWAKDSRSRSIRLRGMTDRSGNARANATLSKQRAEAVRTYLVRQGVDPTRVSAVGHDDDAPTDGDEDRRAVSVVTCLAAPMALATDPPPFQLHMPQSPPPVPQGKRGPN